MQGTTLLLELEKLLDLRLLLELGGVLELDEGGGTRDELLNSGVLELLDALLVEGALLLDCSPELELSRGSELDEPTLPLDVLVRLELLLGRPGILLLELCRGGMYDELESDRPLLLLL